MRTPIGHPYVRSVWPAAASQSDSILAAIWWSPVVHKMAGMDEGTALKVLDSWLGAADSTIRTR